MPGIPSVFDLTTIDGLNGFRVVGAPDDYAGSSIASAGDVNGDGLDDIVVGAPAEPGPSWRTDYAAHVIFGVPYEDAPGAS